MAQPAHLTTIVHKSSNYTIQATENGTAFVADVAGLVFTLPAVEDGLMYTFLDPIADSAHPLTVRPQATDHIFIAAGGETPGKPGIVADYGQKGAMCTLLGVSGVGWFDVVQTKTSLSYEY
jgi:hypothetical protein